MGKHIVFVMTMINIFDDIQTIETTQFKKYKTVQFNSLKSMNNIKDMVRHKRIRLERF